MGNRGFTLLELLLGLLLGTVVLGGISSLFLYSQRVVYQSESQTFLQRQGALVMDQMTQRILSASEITRPCPTHALNLDSILITNTVFKDPDGTNRNPFCFYRSGAQLKMDTATATYDLLSHTAASLTATGFTTNLNDPRVTITFQISDNRGNSMTFTTDLTRRN